MTVKCLVDPTGSWLFNQISSVTCYGMGQFGDRRFGAAVSAMKCEIRFPLECHQSATVRTVVVKRVGARFGLALVPIVQHL